MLTGLGFTTLRTGWEGSACKMGCYTVCQGLSRSGRGGQSATHQVSNRALHTASRLGHNLTMKKNSLSCDASHFDESYASPGHNGKNHSFLSIGVEEKALKKICSAISGLCSLGTNKSTGDQSTGPPLVHQGLAPARAINSP